MKGSNTPRATKNTIALICAALLCSCSTIRERAERAEIQKAFEADRAAHTRIFHGKELANLPARAGPRLITDYTQALRLIDFSKTPTDFRVAYLEHIQAWEGLAEEMNRKPEPADGATLLGILGLFGGAHCSQRPQPRERR